MLQFRILGPLEVLNDSGRIRVGGPKQRATLTILLLEVNRVVSVEALAEDLYNGAPPATAVAQVQRQIYELRRTLGEESTIETRPPGYVLHLAPDQLDLGLFERQADEATAALERGDAGTAALLLRAALRLWRGRPFADLAYESFAQASIARLEEIRLVALEQRIEADLLLGRHATLVAELEQLMAEHPLRERLHAQLMLALYRSGRQAEALDVYRGTRATLVDQFGIEPSPTLHELERRILAQDQTLDLGPSSAPPARSRSEPDRTLLIGPSSRERLERLLAIAEPLATSPPRELLIVRLLSDESELEDAVSALNTVRSSLAVRSRASAFTTADPTGDLVRLAVAHDVELVLLDAPAEISAEPFPEALASLLERSPADVALLTRPVAKLRSSAVFVPFGGSEHDWAALELAAWLAAAVGASLKLVGTRADLHRGERDASRLLADAALAVQRVVGVDTEALLADRAQEVLVAAVEPASLVIAGISPRWRTHGIGASRRALVRDADPPTLLVHRGPRPGGLAPRGSSTRFTWTIEG